jgi:hypothetical protein
LLDIDQGCLISGGGKDLRDPIPHRTGTDHRDMLYLIN